MPLQDVLTKLAAASMIASAPLSTEDHNSIEEELKKVTADIYERNVELAIRNRTFTILRKIYDVINTSLGIEDTAKRVIDAIIEELKFQKGFIALISNDLKELKSVAASHHPPEFEPVLEQYGQPFRTFKSPITNTNNFCVASLINNQTRITNELHEVLTPSLDEKAAIDIEEKLNIQTTIIYPIIFGSRKLGILGLCINKHIGFLSRNEREILKELIEVVAIAIERSQIYADLKKANEKLHDANIRLQELDHLKDEFVSVASHELRTPMTAIKSYLWLALAGRGGPISEKQKFYLDRAYNSTDRLLKLVNDMLNVSRIESGRMSFEIQQVDMVKLVNEVIGEVKPRADELGLNIKVENNITFEAVMADPDKIKEVLINLIGNSLKFTPSGGFITICFEKTPRQIVTHVQDNGAGIPDEDLSKLFQKFGLLKGSYTVNQNAAQGTGLGLYICREILNQHKGAIWASSQGRGKGSQFSFALNIYNEREFYNFQEQMKKAKQVGIVHTVV